MRRLHPVTCALAAGALLLPALPGPPDLSVPPLPAAAAAPAVLAGEGQRGWQRFGLVDHSWKPAPASLDDSPADGTVLGLRYAVRSGEDPRPPRVVQVFEEICGSTVAVTGKKRVAVVLDFGRDADAPDPRHPAPAAYARCVVADPSATTARLLSAVAPARVQGDRVCAVDGYPGTGCGETHSALTADQQAPDDAIALPDQTTATATPRTQATTQATAQASPATATSGTSASRWLWILAGLLAVATVVSAVVGRGRPVTTATERPRAVGSVSTRRSASPRARRRSRGGSHRGA